MQLLKRYPLTVWLLTLGFALTTGTTLAAAYTWNINAAGPTAWNANASWLPNTGFPNTIDDIANLTKDISANNAISMGAPITLGTLNIGDANGNNTYTINSGSALTFDVTSGAALLNRTATGNGVDAINTGITRPSISAPKKVVGVRKKILFPVAGQATVHPFN